MMNITRPRNRLSAFFLALALAGCAQIGPKTVTVDRFDYSTAIAESWKQQTLLNIVKLRYLDLPVFVDVASIVSGYSMETSGNIGGQLSSANAIQGNSLSLGAAGKFTDRPTITYVPLTGEKFLRGLLAPIDPKHIFSMLQSGYAADFILALSVESLNGVRNRSASAVGVREADPDFSRAMVLLRDVQAAGALGVRVEQEQGKAQTAVLFFRRDDLSADIVDKAKEVRRLLKMPEDQQKYQLIYSPVRGAAHELAVNSRSMLQIMGAFASYMDVPETHLKEHGAVPDFDSAAADTARKNARIHSAKERPANAFVAVPYRDYWFWIDDSDWQTKRALTAIIFIFTLTDTGGNEKLPLITIPAQ